MAGLFTLTATVLLSIRRVDLERDLARHAVEIADAVSAGLEPLDPATGLAMLRQRVEWTRQRQGSFKLEILIPGGRLNETWVTLIEAAEAAGQPVGRFFV